MEIGVALTSRYVEGSQHVRTTRYKTSRFDSSIFVLQNDAAARKWPCTKAVCARLRGAFKSKFNEELEARKGVNKSSSAPAGKAAVVPQPHHEEGVIKKKIGKMGGTVDSITVEEKPVKNDKATSKSKKRTTNSTVPSSRPDIAPKTKKSKREAKSHKAKHYGLI
jgi:hypothetical protein